MTKRLFIAIPYIPTREVLNVIGQLKNATINDKINWVKPKNMHLTLKFLGETDVSMIKDIAHGLSIIANRFTSFEMKVTGFEMFYRGKHPSVLYLKLEENIKINELAKEVISFCESMKLNGDGNSFKAHITVARIKYMTMNESVMNKISPKFNTLLSVDEFALIESKLSSEGPTYEVVEKFEFLNN